MRPGFLLAMLGLGALALFALLLISPSDETTSPDQPLPPVYAGGDQLPEGQRPEEGNLAGPAKLPPAQPFSIGNAKEEASEEPGRGAADEKHEASVAARIAELRNLSNKRDLPSVETLLSEVKNPDPVIRQAALDAISQSGNRALIPRLIEAAEQAENVREKQAIMDVVEFMNLPTLTEVLSGKGKENRAPEPRP